MKQLIILFTFTFSLSLGMNISAAVKIVECEDKEGNRSFQKTCPPGSNLINEKKIRSVGESKAEQYTSTFKLKKSATLYVIPECDTCDEVREFLTDNEVLITEIDVSSDYEVQTKFEAIAGSLRVPVTVIDEKMIHGYKRSEFKAALELNSNNNVNPSIKTQKDEKKSEN